MKKISFLLILILLLTGCSSIGEENSNGFKIGSLSTQEFEDNEKYFIIMPIEWTGKNSATIKSIELVKQNEEPVNLDDRIDYVFHGADALKGIGVYPREDIGEIKDLKGFKVKGESRVVLEISMTNVRPDSNRSLKIKYLVGGEEKEQVIKSAMIENLRTKE
ncbi:hypothetical protein [Saccharibacillus kuerlensis]|uniref:Uncharacterized protein n=1 Tax=Saccharibacillus kuerlensis TaxID=459527 RepID=A0ABQ2L396_9BACL|nr:hypothetical protein [Saccharibacillus kuerlensis]GGO00953.1 hypothetical protein GCM10010969_22720 [Saccharibacillus kuerlensis]